MKANIVYIKTEEDSGTGVLYPCRYNNDNLYYTENYQSYIIFTNSHVLSKFEGINYKNYNIKSEILLKIYDANGSRIIDQDIKKVLVHNIQFDNKNYNDVAALLVFINNRVHISIENQILDEELKNRDILYMEGYPGVMIEDSINQKVQLEGIAKEIFPENNKMGIYQITDDYHWYNNKKDLKLMEGFSGSPVYVERGEKFYLVGMNQSVSNIDCGENPFKLVYYIKIKHIIERLRETSCILYKKESDSSYTIEWIYGTEDKIKKYQNNPSLLLVGSSGAGKSSFAKDFAYSSDKLQVTNDGQTTRTNIIYEYSIFCDNPTITVRFLSRKEYLNSIKTLNYDKVMLYVYMKIFNLTEKDYIIDTSNYIKDFYYFLKACPLQSSGDILKSIENIFLPQGEDINIKVKMADIYLATIKYFLKNVGIDNVKYFCDRTKIESLKSSYKEDIINSKQKIDDEGLFDLFKKRLVVAWDSYERDINKEVIEVLFKYCNDKYSFDNFQVEVFDILQKDSYDRFPNFDFLDKNFLDILFRAEGFFDISEVSYLFSDNINENVIFDRVIENFTGIKINTLEVLERTIEDIYNFVYEMVFEKIKNNYIITEKNINGRRIIYCDISLEDIESEGLQKLTYFLQVSNGRSLTGFVNSIKIKDRISNEYALLLSELKIGKITLLDTCGLDHVERSSNIKEVLQNNIASYERAENIRFEDFNILYLKKLDSGKPDELRNILPIVFEVIPQSPFYCIFTGIDIYYKSDTSKIQQLDWNKSNINDCPKAIQYILSDKGEAELISNIKGSNSRKNNLYLVLKNNFVPYCGIKELVESNFGYYDNNYSYIRKMLVSIIRKEYSSLGIVDANDTEDILNKNRLKIERMILRIFQKASVYYWDYNNVHNATATANFIRIRDQEQLGFSRTFNHIWSHLFYSAYNDVVTKDNEDFLELFPKNKEVIESTLINMITSFLGKTVYLYYFEIIDDTEGTNIGLDENKKEETEEVSKIKKNSKSRMFRDIIEEMYDELDDDGNRIYEYNIFKKDLTSNEYNEYKVRKKVLEDVYNFTKGYSLSGKIKNKVIDLFIEAFMSQLNKDNHAKANSLVEVDLNFSKALNDLEKGFIEKYSVSNYESGKEMFNYIMSYRFKNNLIT
ncbi:hypothetical protein JHL18_15520 [Clostridium sp. YIM B02505]|uniref:Serine protease n=1 Tax=Clostridium yunnanense TaxID=2800325 RepID=A0ABS1ERL8_9CLOT|nr:hypothetical protein [Clostridium yunnanense]MBK1812031.1 hypothetical protein [Clostridium yunnanense]